MSRSSIRTTFIILAASLMLAACASGAAAPTSLALPATVTEGAQATETPAPSATPTESAVPTPDHFVIYDFLQLACQASWSNNGQRLPCPGEQWERIGPGYVGLIEDPVVEGGQQAGETALLTHPARSEGYYGIFGVYPPMRIRAGDELRAAIGCLEGVEAQSCEVQYAIDYYDENGEYHAQAWTWEEGYDGQLSEIRADLSALAGQTVRLVLVVRDQGDAAGDYAVWLHAQLWREKQ